MMVLPELMMRIWDGDPNEYFTHVDMNRVEYNANIVARECGVEQVSFETVTRASQFRFDETNRLEALILACAQSRGLSPSMELSWNYNHTVSYVDFERWESALWEVYHDLGGVGERIPSDKFLHTVHATLFKNSWKGSGPYYQDLDMPFIYPDTEAIVFVSEVATVEQRAAEYNALLQAVYQGDRRVRVYAHSIKPREDIPIKVTTKAFDMYKSFTLAATGWQGSGPWTQTVDIGQTVANAVIGSDERNSTEQVQAFAEAIIGASAISGSMVTVRAIGTKPATDIYATVMWSGSNIS